MWQMVTRLITLWCVEMLRHYVAHLEPTLCCRSVMLLLLFSHSVVSNSSRPHGLQHTRLPCPWTPPRGCSNSCPLSLWCHPTISSSGALFSFCLPFFPASGSQSISFQHQHHSSQRVFRVAVPAGYIQISASWEPTTWCNLHTQTAYLYLVTEIVSTLPSRGDLIGSQRIIGRYLDAET